MGTRHLTCVIQGSNFKVAQYGQWDGDPEGQGYTILDFLAKADMGRFRRRINQCQWIDQDNFAKRYSELGLPEDGFLTMDQSEIYKREFPLFSRDLGGDILEAIYNHNDGDVIEVQDDSPFAHDSLFCEWAYVIDLDRNVFEVYRGFNEDVNADSGVFAKIPKPKKGLDSKYYSVMLIKTYPLNDLPNINTLIEECNPPEEEDEDEEFY